MNVHLGFEAWKSTGRTVVSVGNYDGVHLGHQRLINRLVAEGRRFGVPSVVITFDPVPRKILRPEGAPALIQTLDQRLRCLAGLSIDHTIVVPFSADFARKTPEEFVREYLIDMLSIRKFVVGESFAFGHERRGNMALLRKMGEAGDFEVEAFPPVQHDGVRISSTMIREKIRAGDVERAAFFLGHPFALVGTVVEGQRLGGTIGIPTANLRIENEILPARGVYVTRAVTGQRSLASVTNIGIRPTLGGTRLTVESHLLDFSGDIYGRKLELEFLARIRDEKRFAGIEELKRQIAEDIAFAKKHYLAS